MIWAVNANWNSINREWNVNANSVTNPNEWNAGNQVFSKLSSFKNSFVEFLFAFANHRASCLSHLSDSTTSHISLHQVFLFPTKSVI